MTFIAACKQFFGFKPGQTLSEFGKEIRDLTAKDREEIAEGLRAAGLDVDHETAPGVAVAA